MASTKEQSLEYLYRLKAAGLCVRCKERRDGPYKWHCNDCALWVREYNRARANSQAQEDTGKGRIRLVKNDPKGDDGITLIKAGSKHKHTMVPGPTADVDGIWVCGDKWKCERLEKRTRP